MNSKPSKQVLCALAMALVLGAGASASGALLEGMMHEIAHHGRFHRVENAGHWLCEENPRVVERLLLDFFSNGPLEA